MLTIFIQNQSTSNDLTSKFNVNSFKENVIVNVINVMHICYVFLVVPLNRGSHFDILKHYVGREYTQYLYIQQQNDEHIIKSQ